MARIRGNMIDVDDDGKLFAAFKSIPSIFKVIDDEGWEPARAAASDLMGDGEYLIFDSLRDAHNVFVNEPWRIRQFSQKDDRLRAEDNPGNDVFYDVTGDYVDIGRVMEGDPENFGNSIMGNPNRVFATITVNLAAAKWTTAEYIVQKQKRILRLVDWMEQYGIRTQVKCILFTGAASIMVTVKEHQDPFDLNHLAIAMHPDFLRRTCLLVMEQSPSWEFGYGDAVAYDDRSLQSAWCEPDDGYTIYVGGYMPYSPNDTEDGYTYENDLSRLDEDFDKIEKQIAENMKENVRFTEHKLRVGRPFMKIERVSKGRYKDAVDNAKRVR